MGDGGPGRTPRTPPPGFPKRLVLASASPRRRELLERLGVEVDVRPAEVDEGRAVDEAPVALVARLAAAKVRAVAHDGEVVVGADTVVALDGEVFGKPVDRDDAARMLRALSGRTHDVVTGVAVGRDGEVASAVVGARVTFAALDDADVEWYLATGEPFDKAGAYGVQGLGARFVRSVEGSWTAVVGLPLAELADLLRPAAPPTR